MTPAEVIRDPDRLDSPAELAQAPEILSARRLGRSDAQGDAVQSHWHVCPQTFEHREWAPSFAKKILADSFDPVDVELPAKGTIVVAPAEADPVA